MTRDDAAPMPVPTTVTDGTPRRDRRRFPLRAVVTAVLAVALAILGWAWSHPSVLGGGGATIGSDSWMVGTPFYVGLSNEDPEVRRPVTIHSARAHRLTRSAPADIAFFVCTLDPSAGIGGIGTAGHDTIRQHCSSLVPAVGATMEPAARPPQVLVMAVTMRSAGELTAQGAEVTYSYGWQRGTEVVGPRVELRSTAP